MMLLCSTSCVRPLSVRGQLQESKRTDEPWRKSGAFSKAALPLNAAARRGPLLRTSAPPGSDSDSLRTPKSAARVYSSVKH